MFYISNKYLLEKIDRQSREINLLRFAIQENCNHGEYEYVNGDFFNSPSVRCSICDKTIQHGNLEECMKIMKDQEIRKAKELIAKVEQEEKENKNE